MHGWDESPPYEQTGLVPAAFFGGNAVAVVVGIVNMQLSLQALMVAARVKKGNDKTGTTTRVWRITVRDVRDPGRRTQEARNCWASLVRWS